MIRRAWNALLDRCIRLRKPFMLDYGPRFYFSREWLAAHKKIDGKTAKVLIVDDIHEDWPGYHDT